MLEHIASTMTNITDLGETHDNLMKDTFEAFLVAPNMEFHQYFSLQKLSWKGGTRKFTCEKLAHLAKTIYNNVVSSSAWNVVDPKDTKIMAPSTQLQQLQSPSPRQPSRTKTSLAHDFRSIADWRKIKIDPYVKRDSLYWWWCDKHEGPYYNGFYVRNKPEFHLGAPRINQGRWRKCP